MSTSADFWFSAEPRWRSLRQLAGRNELKEAPPGAPCAWRRLAVRGLQCLHCLSLHLGASFEALQRRHFPFEDAPGGHLADNAVGLVVRCSLDNAHKARSPTGKPPASTFPSAFSLLRYS